MSLTPEQMAELQKQIHQAQRKASEAAQNQRESQVALDRARKILDAANK